MLKIEFIHSSKYVCAKELLPEPIAINIPEWFKKLKHNKDSFTVKGCMPFLQSLTTGYLLRLPQDFDLKHNQIDKDGNPYTDLKPSYPDFFDVNLNNQEQRELHGTYQFKDSPHQHKNLDLPSHKILNPFIIKTPPGYSCLFVPPLNNTDDRFSIIPAIVNTDLFWGEVNFPMIVNGDKYPSLDTTLKKGTPYVQIIPFKREDWKMEINKSSKKNLDKFSFWDYFTNSIYRYKKNVWKKVIYK